MTFSAKTPFAYDQSKDLPSCCVCGRSSGLYRQQLDSRYSIHKCANCGLEYTNPTPTKRDLWNFYQTYHDVRAPYETVLRNARNNIAVLTRYGWKKDSKLLDFGTGKGVFLRVAGANAHGIDSKPRPKRRVHGRLEGALKRQKWDFITMFGVLEHLPHPLKTTVWLARRLNTNGYMFITTVDAEGSIPYHYKPPEHLTYWTREAARRLGEACGLKLVDYHPYWMHQKSRIYLQRLLSRTPKKYCRNIHGRLPKNVYVPTNECVILFQKLDGKDGGA